MATMVLKIPPTTPAEASCQAAIALGLLGDKEPDPHGKVRAETQEP